MMATVKRLLGGAALVGIARQVATLSDEYARISNQLKLVTSGSENLARVQGELYNLAQETRSPLEATATLYARVARNAADLGLSQEALLGITKAVNQAIQVGGGSAAEASSGVIQFSQALASGVLRGDELRSILENMPRLAGALAEGLGVGVGELRKLGEAGELTSQKVVEALQKTAPGIAAEFEKLTPTIGSAFTVLQNSMLNFVGTLDKASGTGSGFASVIIKVAGTVDNLTQAFTGALQPTQELSSGFQVFASVMLSLYTILETVYNLVSGVLGTAFKTLGDLIGGTAASLVAFFSGDFKQAWAIGVETQKNALANITQGIAQTTDNLVSDMSMNIEKIVELWNKGARDAAPAQAKLLAAGAGKKEESFGDIVNEINRNDPFAGMRNSPVIGEYDNREAMVDAGEQSLKELEAFADKEWDLIKFKTKQFGEESNEFAREAARGMQNAFADFLFDPFKDGLDGMLEGLVDTLRRVTAEILAAKALQAFGNLLAGSSNSWLQSAGSIFQGASGRAEGGSVQRGVPYMVNERQYQKRRPEVFVPSKAGRIMDQSRVPAGPDAGGTTVIVSRDPEEIPNAIASARGRDVLVQQMSTYPGVFKRALGLG